MITYPMLEILGQVRLLGLSAENVHGVVLVAGTHTINRSGERYVVRTDDCELVASMPAHWDAEAVAAVVVCVVMLGATSADVAGVAA